MKKNFFNLYYQLNLLLRWSTQGVGDKTGEGGGRMVNKDYKFLKYKLKEYWLRDWEQRWEATIMEDAKATGYGMYPCVS